MSLNILRIHCAVCLFVCIAGFSGKASSETFPVPKITLYPGDVIEDHLLTDRNIRLRRTTARPYFRRRIGIVGKVARRTLLRGRPIPLNSVRKPDAVTRGKPVQVIFQSDGLTISSSAMPLQSGSVGDTISFRNLDSGAILRGKIATNGIITVGGS